MSTFTRNIQHVVVLMLENRSFDHMLGFLGTPRGLRGTEANEVDPANPGTRVRVSRDAAYAGDLDVDPSHRFEDVNIQLYGADPPPQPLPASSNGGFVLDYGRQPGVTLATAGAVMKCFAPDRLPALTTLAREFVVCDRWFASVPAQTWPNRLFVHAATSMGFLDNTPRVYGARTIYDSLSDAGENWAVYFHDMPQCVMLASVRQAKFRKNFKVFAERFKLDCTTGLLPSYSFIEPRYFDFLQFKANDQHPPHDVALGDQLIADVYEAIRKSPMWDTTLFVVVWDEHGGIFDHLSPEQTVTPDGLVHANPDFDFTRLGLRVPAVLVSPYTERGRVDDTIYDHTSILASLNALFDLTPLTARDAAANTFEHLITDIKRNDAPVQLPRAQPSSPPPPAVTTARMSDETVAASLDTRSTQPLSEYQESLVDLAKTLESDAPPRARIARLASRPDNEHTAAVHVRQATAEFLDPTH